MFSMTFRVIDLAGRRKAGRGRGTPKFVKDAHGQPSDSTVKLVSLLVRRLVTRLTLSIPAPEALSCCMFKT